MLFTPAGEEVLLIQEKLDGIKSRYAEMTGGSSKALRILEQALQLSTRFASAHDDLNQWLDKVEAELNVMEPDATPAYQDRQKVGDVFFFSPISGLRSCLIAATPQRPGRCEGRVMRLLKHDPPSRAS